MSACDSPKASKRTPGTSSRAVAAPTLVSNAWTAPAVLAEWTSKSYYGGANFELISGAGGGFFAGWANGDGQAQLAKHSTVGGPWEAVNPLLAGFKTVFPPHLYTNPQSSAVFAAWYSPDRGLGGNFISRYTPQTGWSVPHAFSDTTSHSKVIVGAAGDAVVLWMSGAEDGSMELNARRVDAQGNVALMDTYVLGKPGRLNTDLFLVNGWITSSGDVEIFGIKEKDTYSNNAEPYSNLQVWKITYERSGALSRAWSRPEGIPNSQFQLNGFAQRIDVVPAENDVFRIIVTAMISMTGTAGTPVVVFESKAGVLNNISPADPQLTSDSLVSAISTNSQGQLAFAWTKFEWAGTSATDQTVETRVFAMQYSNTSGWIPSTQINNSTRVSVPSGMTYGTGTEAQVSLNSSGRIVVAWRNPAETSVNLYSNFYDPVTKWHGEELAAATTATSDQVPLYGLALNETGDSLIFWQEAQNGADGATTVKLQAVDHVGAGNGVAKAKATRTIRSIPALGNGISIQASSRPTNRLVTKAITPKQRIDRLRATANVRPIRPSSAWDEPTILGELSAPTFPRFINTLHVNSNDRGDALVSFLVDPDKPTNVVWSGDMVGGVWKQDSPPIPAGSSPTYIGGSVVDPVSGNFYLGWATECQNKQCVELSVSRKLSDGSWEAPTVFGESVRSGLGLLANSSGIGATWYSSVDTLGNPTIAYAEHNNDTGWSIPDSFSPSTSQGAVGSLSHGDNTAMAAVLGESGVVSIVADVFGSPTNIQSVLVQRDPATGWKQKDFPLQIQLLSSDTVHLSATGPGDSVHAIVSDGMSSGDMREIAYEFAGGKWGPQLSVTAPKKGDIFGDGFGTLSKDSNSKGQVLVAWQEQIVSDFNLIRQLRVNWYDPARGWGSPIDIGYPIPGGFNPVPGASIYDVVSLIRVSINESGQGAVTWIDSSEPQQALNIVHLDSTMSKVDHEIVLSIDPAKSWFAEFDLDVDRQGRAILVWDEISSGSPVDTHRIKTTTHHLGGAISPQPIIPPVIPTPQMPTAPKQAAGWSDKELAVKFPEVADRDYLTQKTGIALVNESPILVTQIDRTYDAITERFASSERTLVSSPSPGVWSNQNTFGTATPDVMASVQLATEEGSQTVYALWVSQKNLFINHQNSSGAWAQPVLVASNSDTGYLLANSRGQVIVAWEALGNPSALQVTEVSLDATNAIKIRPASGSTLAASTLLGKPIFSSQGTLAALRAISGGTVRSYILSRYDFGKGWQTATNKTLDLNQFLPSTLQLAITSNNQVVAFAQSDTLRTLHSALLRTDGSWSTWASLQDSKGLPVSLTGQYRIGTSSAGHIYATWVEEVIGIDGEPVNYVMFSSSNVVDIVTGNPWKAPTQITRIRHPNFNETPLLLVARNGAAAIIWQQTITPMESEGIMVRKYAPTTGWALEPEIAAGFSLSFSGSPMRINAQISTTNALFIVWETMGDSFWKIPSGISMTRGRI